MTEYGFPSSETMSADEDFYGDMRLILDDDLAAFVREEDRHRSLTVVREPGDRDAVAEIRRWLDRIRIDGGQIDACAAMRRAIERWADGSRDNQMRGVLAVVRLDERGHRGLPAALDELWSVRAKDARDFWRLVEFARERILSAPSSPASTECHCDHAPAEAQQFPPPANPMAVARKLVREHQVDDGLTLRWWRGGWMQHHGTAWAEVEDTVIRKAVYAALEHARYWHETDKTAEWRPWLPTRRKVADLLDAYTTITHLPETVDTPAWLGRTTPPAPADRIVAVENGLLDVRTRTLHPATPRYFNRVAVPFRYDKDAPKPARWLKFLSQLWPDDEASINALQEWCGYVLSGRTDLQKILLLIGPTRSGKGTVARVLAALVGVGNVAGPTLASLGTNFGLAPLLGKPLAVVSDARLGRGDVHQVVERLLSISGEDMLTVDRKFREPWTGKLPARFMILSNELPRFGDASGAIADRFVVLSMTTSFLGKEDTTLTADLLDELPGILRWSLDGLDRLTTNKVFTQPPASADAITALQDLVSPVAAFVRDTCTKMAGTETVVSTMFSAWRTWCEDNGHKPGSVQTFGRDLRAVIPGLRVTRPHGQERRYVGLAIADVVPAMQNTAVQRGSAVQDTSTQPLNRSEPRQNPLQPLHQHICSRCRRPASRLIGDRCPDCAYPTGGRPEDDNESA